MQFEFCYEVDHIPGVRHWVLPIDGGRIDEAFVSASKALARMHGTKYLITGLFITFHNIEKEHGMD
jgi:hypothetical protein